MFGLEQHGAVLGIKKNKKKTQQQQRNDSKKQLSISLKRQVMAQCVLPAINMANRHWERLCSKVFGMTKHPKNKDLPNNHRKKDVKHKTRSIVFGDQKDCFVLFVGCLPSQQHASVSQGRICTDNFTCCHSEIEAADQTFHLTQSQYTDTRPTSPSADPITPGAWQGSHWSANFEVTGMTRPRKNPGASGIRTRDLPLSRRTP